ncbi:MAG: hypothetical protein J6A61_04475 [Clostridia bacterium]|nr:hypothetical protein [Clostridia bacterium]
MNQTAKIICCASGGILIGCFANQLHTGNTVAMFILGVVLLTISAITISKTNE